jgi:hypothetical protein
MTNKRTDIAVSDTAFIRDAEDIADRIPGNMPAVGDLVPGKLCFP